MAHKLMARDVQFGIEQAWHKLTKIVPLITCELAFPWKVLLQELAYRNADGVFVPYEGVDIGDTDSEKSQTTEFDPGEKDIWRLPVASDDFLPFGYGTPVNLRSYTMDTPQQSWVLLEEILKGCDFNIVSALTVQNRSKFAISAKLTELENVSLQDGSQIEIILNAIGSLDKTLKKAIVLSGTRTVCANTLNMNFLQKDNNWQWKHTKNMDAQVKSDVPAIERVAGYSAIVKATFDALIHKPCSQDRAAAVYAGFITQPVDRKKDWPAELSTRAHNMVDEHVFCFRRGDGNEGKSEFDLLNGFTQPRTRGYSESNKDKWSTFASSEMGSYGKSKSEFAELLVTGGERLSLIESKGRALLATV